MSNICDVTGTKPSFGNAVFHSERRTRRRRKPNIQHRRYRLADGRTIRLKVSTKGIKIIDRDGIDTVVAGAGGAPEFDHRSYLGLAGHAPLLSRASPSL